MEGSNFRRGNGSSTTAKDTDVLAACLIKQLADVGEVLDVAALVRRQGYGVSVFLNGAVKHGFCRLVVAEMDDFSPRGFNQSAHDVDGGIVAVKQ